MAGKGDNKKVGRDSNSGKFIPTKDTGKNVRDDQTRGPNKSGGETESTGPKKK